MLIPKFQFPRCARNDKNGEKKWGAWDVAFSPIYRPPISFYRHLSFRAQRGNWCWQIVN